MSREGVLRIRLGVLVLVSWALVLEGCARSHVEPVDLTRAPSPLAPLELAQWPRVVTQGETWVAVSIDAGDHTVAVQGVRSPIAEEGLRGANAVVAGEAALATHNEGIATVSWNHEGVVWSLDVECAAGPDDPRCAGDDYALRLASTLHVMVDDATQ